MDDIPDKWEWTDQNMFNAEERYRQYKFEKVNQFLCLGVTITSKDQEEWEIDKRILKENKTMRESYQEYWLQKTQN